MSGEVNHMLMLQRNLLVSIALLGKKKLLLIRKKYRKKRFWIRKIFQERKRYGHFQALTQELRIYHRMIERMIGVEKEQNLYCQPLIPEITSQCHCASELSVCYPTFEITFPNLKQITHLHLVDVHLNLFFPAVALTMLSSMKPMLS